MENLTVDTVYGSGLYEAARDLNSIDEFQSCLGEIREFFNDDPAFLSLLKTPTIEANERKKIAEEVFKDQIPTELLNFIFVLIDKRRIGQFIGITKTFEKICDENNGIVKGEIISALPLKDAQILDFEKETGALLRKNVKLVNQIDKSIIGGIKIYIDGKLIDASVRGRLDELKEKML